MEMLKMRTGNRKPKERPVISQKAMGEKAKLEKAGLKRKKRDENGQNREESSEEERRHVR